MRVSIWIFVLVLCGCTREQSPPVPAVPAEPEVWNESLSWEEMIDRWNDGDPIPNVELIDQNGKPFRLREYKDRYVFITFVYARGPVETMCPLTMVKTRQVQKKWADAKEAGKAGKKELQFLTITLDPKNDTAPVLRMFAERFGVDYSNWTLAGGPEKLVRKGLPSLFNVLAIPGPEGTIDHGVKAILLQPGLMPKREDGWTWPDNQFDPSKIVETLLDDR